MAPPTKPSWALMTTADEGATPRVRGRPFTRTVDADGFELVTGGFRPMKQEITLNNFGFRAQGSRQRSHVRFSTCDLSDSSHLRIPSHDESSEELLPTADDGKQLAPAQLQDDLRSGPGSRNSIDAGSLPEPMSFHERVAQELDKRQQATAATTPTVNKQTSFSEIPETLFQREFLSDCGATQDTHTHNNNDK